MSARLEFRVKWKREGRKSTTAIYQTAPPALQKADRLMALDAVKADTKFADMPDLVAPPTIEQREVGEWEQAGFQLAEPTDEACASMEEWLVPGSQSGVAMGDVF